LSLIKKLSCKRKMEIIFGMPSTECISISLKRKSQQFCLNTKKQWIYGDGGYPILLIYSVEIGVE